MRSRLRRPAAAGERELLSGELPDPTDVPQGCRFHPRCPKRFGPCDSVDPGLLPAGGQDQLAACLLHDPAHAGAAPRACLSAGATSPGPSATSSRASETRSPTCPACASATRRPQSGQRTGVTVVEPPELPAMAGTAVVNGTGELTRSSRSTRPAGWTRRSTSAGRTPSGPSIQAAIIASGRGPQDVVIPVVGECDDGDLADSRTIVAGRRDARARRARPGRGRGQRSAPAPGMQLFEFPGGIGTASRRVGEWTRRRAPALQLRRARVPRPSGNEASPAGPPVERHDGSCIAVCATDAPLIGAAAGTPRAAPAARPRPRGLVRR